MNDHYLKMILKARVYDVAQETPLDFAPSLSRRTKSAVWLKREDLQPVFSYKLRGAFNLMSSLSPEQRTKGVIAASAGNHAQGVALAARKLGIRATIVMPQTTPQIKVSAVQELGAEIVLHGNAYDEASQHARELMDAGGQTYIPPYDHPLVIAGQGTVAMELMHQHEGGLDAVFIPVGGGGLIAGMGAYIKALYPQVKVIGVEPEEAPCMTRALEAGERVRLDHVGIFADGAAVRQAGEECFKLAQTCVDEMLTVSTDEICAAVKDIFEDTRSIAEPAGALALAGLKQYAAKGDHEDERYVAVISGANVNFDRLRHIAELAELGEGREMLIGATIPERPGAFRAFCEALGPRLVTEFNYRYSDKDRATVFAGVQLRGGRQERANLLQGLSDAGIEVADLSDDEMAKMHVRHMVGGHAGEVANERLYRFEFPERPGALLQFLSAIGERWNISLFHYRNHGAAYGRVLMGIQVPDGELTALGEALDNLGMNHHEETGNAAYRLFLK